MLKPTELIRQAVKDGVKTVSEFNKWRKIHIEERDEDQRLTAEDIKYEMASQRAGEIL